MMTRFTSQSGIIERYLVGVIAWALSAVVLLTATLTSARRIDERVAYITTQVSPIDTDLDTVALLNDINANARDIETAAAPLSGQLDDVLASVGTIDTSAKSILDTAGSINSTVDSIFSHAGEINGTVQSINGKATTINGTVTSILGNATEINGTVKSIDGHFVGIRDNVFTIRGPVKDFEGFGTGLHGAARKIDALLVLITGIKSDTGNILALVGSIDASAKSIDSKAGAL